MDRITRLNNIGDRLEHEIAQLTPVQSVLRRPHTDALQTWRDKIPLHLPSEGQPSRVDKMQLLEHDAAGQTWSLEPIQSLLGFDLGQTQENQVGELRLQSLQDLSGVKLVLFAADVVHGVNARDGNMLERFRLAKKPFYRSI